MRRFTTPARGGGRFLKAAGAMAAGLFAGESLEAYPQNTNTNSKPSDLRITDLRTIVLRGAPMTCPLIRIDTNQGIYGLGEVRDGASKNYALMLKSRLLGENPCNVDKLFRKIKQFGGHARQGGGVCGVEMALWDLAGKAYNVPVYQMLGGKFRDTHPLYCRHHRVDTTRRIYGQRLKERKDAGLHLAEDGSRDRSGGRHARARSRGPRASAADGGGRVQHMFTGIELTPTRASTMMGEYVAAVREAGRLDSPALGRPLRAHRRE